MAPGFIRPTTNIDVLHQRQAALKKELLTLKSATNDPGQRKFYVDIFLAVECQSQPTALEPVPNVLLHSSSGSIIVGDEIRDSIYGLSIEQILFLVDYELIYRQNVFFLDELIVSTLALSTHDDIRKMEPTVKDGKQYITTYNGDDEIEIPREFIFQPGTSRDRTCSDFTVSEIVEYRKLSRRLVRHWHPDLRERVFRLLDQHNPAEPLCKFPVYASCAKTGAAPIDSLEAMEAVRCASLNRIPKKLFSLTATGCGYLWEQEHITFDQLGANTFTLDRLGQRKLLTEFRLGKTSNEVFFKQWTPGDERAYTEWMSSKRGPNKAVAGKKHSAEDEVETQPGTKQACSSLSNITTENAEGVDDGEREEQYARKIQSLENRIEALQAEVNMLKDTHLQNDIQNQEDKATLQGDLAAARDMIAILEARDIASTTQVAQR